MKLLPRPSHSSDYQGSLFNKQELVWLNLCSRLYQDGANESSLNQIDSFYNYDFFHNFIDTQNSLVPISLESKSET